MTDVSKYLKPNETCWVQYKDVDGTLRYIVITKNIYRDKHYLVNVLEMKTNLIPVTEEGELCQNKNQDPKSE